MTRVGSQRHSKKKYWNNAAFDRKADFGWTWGGSGRGLNTSMTLGFKFHLVTRTEVFHIYLLLLLLLLLLLALQPTVGFSLLSDFLPICSFFTLFSPPSYSHYVQIFFSACNPSLPSSPFCSRTYRFPL